MGRERDERPLPAASVTSGGLAATATPGRVPSTAPAGKGARMQTTGSHSTFGRRGNPAGDLRPYPSKSPSNASGETGGLERTAERRAQIQGFLTSPSGLVGRITTAAGASPSTSGRRHNDGLRQTATGDAAAKLVAGTAPELGRIQAGEAPATIHAARVEAEAMDKTLARSSSKRPERSTDVTVKGVSEPTVVFSARDASTCLNGSAGMTTGRDTGACPGLRIAGMELQPVAAELMATHRANVGKLFSRRRMPGELLRTVPDGPVTSSVATKGDKTSTGDCVLMVLTVPTGEDIADANAAGESSGGVPTPEPTAAVSGPCGVNSAIDSTTAEMVYWRSSRQALCKSSARRVKGGGAVGMVTWQDSRPTLVDSQAARVQGRTVSFRRADVGAGRVRPSPVDYTEKLGGGISGCDEESLLAETVGAPTNVIRRKRSRSSRGDWPPNNHGQGSRKKRKR